MTLLAHVSDLHLIEREHYRRSAGLRNRLKFLSFYAPDIDFEARRRRVAEALDCIKGVGVDHVLVTGDLTEDGVPEQFEVLAEVLHGSGIAPERFTLVPGNHDGYDSTGAWDQALAGPLRDFMHGSDIEPVVLRDAVVVPVSTMIEPQSFVRAQGVIRPEDMQRVSRIYAEHSGRAVVVAQHHPLNHYLLPPLQWFNGVHGAQEMRQMLMDRPRLHVAHGHEHESVTKHLMGRSWPQLLCPYSIRDDYSHEDSIRFYKAENGVLRVVSLAEALSYRPCTSGVRRGG